MTSRKEARSGDEALRDRMARLTGAVLRIGASLDPDAVLHEAAASIGTLTRARCGAIVTVDDEGRAHDIVGSGLTPDERRDLLAWPDGRRLFEHLRDLPGATKLRDLPAYVRSLGLSPDVPLSKTVLAAPMRHGGVHVGTVLAGAEHEFSGADQAVFELFAAQAAAAVANARTRRDERRARAEFLGMASHELRAPLAAIKGSAAAVLEASQDLHRTEMLQFFRIVDEQANHMRRLIGDLLEAGRVEAGTLSVVPRPVSVGAFVEAARHTFVSGGGRHAVRIDLAPDLPRVAADSQRIVQVLNNLVANAARHSPESSPIRVAAALDGAHVAISVSDEGRGVSREKLPHLFREHAPAASADREGGDRETSLGLAICKRLVEAHEGRIWAESAGEDKGARFTFTIPVVREPGGGDAVGDAPSGTRRPEAPRGRKCVLVVDDDPTALRRFGDALTGAGYAVSATPEPREVARLIATEKPHLVVLDLVLPGIDGIELMEHIRETADLPVIFVSAYGRDETIARALDRGAADYVVKPVSATELTARVGAVLRRHAEPGPFLLHELVIRYEQREVTVAGRRVELTATEYELLAVLSLNAGRVMTYDALLRRVWPGQGSGDARLVRTYVKVLRRKLGDSAKRSAYILTERGVGYRMAGPGPEPEPSVPRS